MKKILYLLTTLLLVSCNTSREKTSQSIMNSSFSDNKTFKLSFDFIKDQETNYSYSGSSEQTGFNSMTDSTMKQTSNSEGLLILRSTENTKAELVYKDIMNESNVLFDIEKNEIKEFTNGPSTSIIQGLNNDGTVSGDNMSEFRIKMLFPISNETYEVGKKHTSKISMPFNLNGSSLVLNGSLITECTAMVIYKGYECAKIISEIKIDESSIPKELKKNNKILIYITGEYFFDINKSIFIYGKVNSKTEMDFLLSMPKMNNEDSKNISEDIRQIAEAEENYKFEII